MRERMADKGRGLIIVLNTKKWKTQEKATSRPPQKEPKKAWTANNTHTHTITHTHTHVHANPQKTGTQQQIIYLEHPVKSGWKQNTRRKRYLDSYFERLDSLVLLPSSDEGLVEFLYAFDIVLLTKVHHLLHRALHIQPHSNWHHAHSSRHEVFVHLSSCPSLKWKLWFSAWWLPSTAGHLGCWKAFSPPALTDAQGCHEVGKPAADVLFSCWQFDRGRVLMDQFWTWWKGCGPDGCFYHACKRRV